MQDLREGISEIGFASYLEGQPEFKFEPVARYEMGLLVPCDHDHLQLRPKLLSLKECIRYFVEHRHEVTIRRTQFDLNKAKERAHILEGLIIACDNIDEVVHIIRGSKTPAEAQTNLEKRFNLDNLQSKAIVDMRLSQLTGLRMDQLHAEYEELEKQITYLQSILDDPELFQESGTGVTGAEAETDVKSTGIYTINGIRVEKTTKGLYIINGKKVMVK